MRIVAVKQPDPLEHIPNRIFFSAVIGQGSLQHLKIGRCQLILPLFVRIEFLQRDNISGQKISQFASADIDKIFLARFVTRIRHALPGCFNSPYSLIRLIKHPVEFIPGIIVLFGITHLNVF